MCQNISELEESPVVVLFLQERLRRALENISATISETRRHRDGEVLSKSAVRRYQHIVRLRQELSQL